MLPYINPNYFQQPQFQNMYQMQQPQITQPNYQYRDITKMVENIEQVKNSEIPVDGQVYFFAKADGTEIYTKQWLTNGTTKVTTYLPQISDDAIKPNNLPLNAIESRFDALNESTDGIKKELNKLTKQLNKFSEQIKLEKADIDES